ncbi:MAG: leucine-rich repeat domain-containing protein, partial [Alphaproteobacteria bacterium]|nr:leucine-rich repeat domain-containing protein [Alphaproteobacteria bacterium]
IKSIGEIDFWSSKIEHIDIPNTVTEIKSNAFCGNHNLDSITIPASVTSIQNNAFDGTNITVFIEGDSMTFGNGLATTAGQPTLYCKQGMDACEGKASSVEYYIKTDNGLYQTVSDNKYFATPSLLLQGIACTDKQNCEDILAAQNAGTSFKVGSKIYNSIEDFEKGNHVKYRIYTVEEANRVAGDRNTVTIRYK